MEFRGLCLPCNKHVAIGHHIRGINKGNALRKFIVAVSADLKWEFSLTEIKKCPNLTMKQYREHMSLGQSASWPRLVWLDYGANVSTSVHKHSYKYAIGIL